MYRSAYAASAASAPPSAAASRATSRAVNRGALVDREVVAVGPRWAAPDARATVSLQEQHRAVDDGDRGRRGDLTELRFRLYRRDPPVGAVEAYLAAVANAAERARTATVRAPAHPRRRRPRRPLPLRSLLGAAAVVGAAVAFAAVLPVAIRELSTIAAVTGPVPSPVATIPMPPSAGVPLGTMAGGPAATSRFAAGGNTVLVGVLCAGRGTLTIRIAGEQPTVLTCDTGAPAYAMLQSTTALDRFTVAVRPQPGARWTLTVGALRRPTDTPTSTPPA